MSPILLFRVFGNAALHPARIRVTGAISRGTGCPPPTASIALVVEDVISAFSGSRRLYTAIFVLGVAVISWRPAYRGPTSGVETTTDLRWLSCPPRARNEKLDSGESRCVAFVP